MLRERVRVQQGRDPTPSAVIIDSPVGEDHGKGGLGATMEARKYMGERGTYWSILRVY